MEELKRIAVNGGDPERYWMVGTSMIEEEQKSLVQFLNQSSDVFALTPHEMPGVDPEVINHKLGAHPKVNLVTQKQRKLASERQMAVCKEVDKLLEANTI